MKAMSESSLTSRPANERAALVASQGSLSYTEEANNDLPSPDPSTVTNQLQGEELDFTEESILSQFHEDAIRQADFGSYQWLAMVTIGLGLSADSIGIFSIPYLQPNIEVDLCSRPAEKGWICEITFLGMVVGSLIWGSLGDHMGRKCILISALSVNFLFNTIAAFMPTYKSFITARFCSAIGIGGIYPLAMIYISEFLPRSSRGKFMIWHLISWLLGGCYILLLAHIFLPKTGMDMIIESRQHVGAWRQFILLCGIPSIPAIIKLVFLAESPRYLLESGRDVEAMMVYQKIFQRNSKKGQYQLSEIELPGPTQSSNRSHSFISEISAARSCRNSFLQLFITPHLKVTILLLIFWFLTGFSYYGLTNWFPGKMQLTLLDDINKNAVNTSLAMYNATNFYVNLQNRHWSNSVFVDCHFSNILLTDVTFDNCTFERVAFTNITSIGAFFMKSSFVNSRFLDTDITRENFLESYLFNTSILSNRKFCKNSFSINIDLSILFQENGTRLIGNFAMVIITGLFIGQISRTRIIGIAMLLSSVGCLAMWILQTQIPVLMYNPVIMCGLIVAWSCANIAVIESYPTNLRSSGFCLMMFVCRSAGLLGVSVYHHFLSLTNSIMIFSTIAVLMTAAVSALKLPNTQTTLL
ncbi:synaptic vesicle glycoprotein 2C-like isoform X2 [Nilaparvata lugens]|nr:synaptic vesicle glycoprotein 2C-like isoform X2 [Nilaparvata lugens]